MKLTKIQQIKFVELQQLAEDLGIEGVFISNSGLEPEQMAIELWKKGFLPIPTVTALLEGLEHAINEEREKQIERQTLRALEHLSYIIECLACDFTGEARTELGNLRNRMKSDDFSRLDDKNSVIGKLEKALDQLIKQDKHRCASILGQISRDLWRRVDLTLD